MSMLNCFILIFALIIFVPAENVALKGVATQSSVYSVYEASNAIDGNRESDCYKGFCTHTAYDTNPWWRVDLMDVYRVTAVITNRGDCCHKRLDGAEIRIGNSLENNGINNPRCVVISLIQSGETKTVQCNEMQGRYIVVVIPGRSEYLSLCEVEVYGTPRVNVVLKGVATPLSIFGPGAAHNAIDGNRDPDFCKGSLDLLDVYRVTAVKITNKDSLPERVNGVEILSGNSLENDGINNPRCARISHISAEEPHTFQCNEMDGRYVVLFIPLRSAYFTLCEFEVYIFACDQILD
uniref:Fucolectin tachylectin-4 pentraxin-1 domain-containing protein n=1 Tax=Hucho hucho TaxID=62062 RepID=A0A4W5RCW7_9TELE